MPVYTPTLKARIALITTILAAVFGTGIVLAALHDAHRDLHDALQDQQDSVVKLSADQLDTAMSDRILLLSRHPARVADFVRYDAPRPRTDATLSEPDFVRIKAHCLEIFQREVRKG